MLHWIFRRGGHLVILRGNTKGENPKKLNFFLSLTKKATSRPPTLSFFSLQPFTLDPRGNQHTLIFNSPLTHKKSKKEPASFPFLWRKRHLPQLLFFFFNRSFQQPQGLHPPFFFSSTSTDWPAGHSLPYYKLSTTRRTGGSFSSHRSRRHRSPTHRPPATSLSPSATETGIVCSSSPTHGCTRSSGHQICHPSIPSQPTPSAVANYSWDTAATGSLTSQEHPHRFTAAL